MDKVMIEITKEEAELWKEFQKNYRFIKYLEEIGAFKMKNAHLTIHLARTGELVTFDLVEKFSHHKLL